MNVFDGDDFIIKTLKNKAYFVLMRQKELFNPCSLTYLTIVKNAVE